MRKLLICVCLMFSITAVAAEETVDLNFENAPVAVVAQTIYKTIIKTDFVMSNDLMKSDKKITLHLSNISKNKFPFDVAAILDRQGVVATLENGVIYLDVKRSGSPVLSPAPVVASAGQNSVGQMAAPALAPAPVPALAPVVVNEAFVYSPSYQSPEQLVESVNFAFPASAVSAGNRVLISAPVGTLPKIKKFMVEVDQETKTVELSAAWVEVRDSSGSNLGIQAAINVLGAKFRGSIGKVTGSSLSISGNAFSLVLDALNSDSRFHQISSSRVLGDDRQKINFTVGDSTPTISSSSTTTAGNPVQNIVYKDSGVLLDVLPKVLANGRINVTIDGQISNFTATTNGVSDSPTLVKRQLKTVVTINDGDVLVLGGLKSSQTTNTTNNLFFLPSSWAMHNDQSAKSDLVLIVSAKVVYSADKQASLPEVN